MWTKGEDGDIFMIALGNVRNGAAKLNAEKGACILSINGTPSLFEPRQHGKLLHHALLVNPESTESAPLAWLVASAGIDRGDKRTLHTLDTWAFADWPGAGAIILDF